MLVSGKHSGELNNILVGLPYKWQFKQMFYYNSTIGVG